MMSDEVGSCTSYILVVEEEKSQETGVSEIMIKSFTFLSIQGAIVNHSVRFL